MKNNTREELSRLLQERNEYPDRVAQIDAEIHENFGVVRAILVMDMSGFSRMTIKHGIIHFLAMIHRMNQIVTLTIGEHGGEIIKFEADNVFAVFETVESAVEAAVNSMKGFAAANTMLPSEMDMHGKFGIGYGETLIVAGEDLFGSEVNLASKLGEDLAGRGEILLTEAAFAQLPPGAAEYEEVAMTISGLQLVVHKAK